jgi:enoyl-CoA hydratase/carnithine racemase
MPKVRFEQDREVGIITISDPPLNLFGRDLIADFKSMADFRQT